MVLLYRGVRRLGTMSVLCSRLLEIDGGGIDSDAIRTVPSSCKTWL
jgi:hypothetical protein